MAETSRKDRGDAREPDEELLIEAVTRALRAPSVYNTQPWRWRIRPDHVELHADPSRHLASTDPAGRDLVISCGAGLHHLCVALAGLGAEAGVARLPDPENRHHLATVRLATGSPDPREVALADQIEARRTDRRPYAGPPLTDAQLEELREAVRGSGAELTAVRDPRALARLEEVLGEAAYLQLHEPGYLADLMAWTHRYAGARDGVTAETRPAAGVVNTEPYLQRFPSGVLATGSHLAPDHGTLLLLTTRADDVESRLRAGEAASAVLLTATRLGLASAPLSQAVELAETRERLRSYALATPDEPQLVLRVGTRAEELGPVPQTPRHPLSRVLLP